MIDIAAHIIPPRLWQKIADSIGSLGREAASRNPGLVDLEERRRTIDLFDVHRYRQVLTLSLQATEDAALLDQMVELCRSANEELRELVEAEPNCFVGALGALPLVDPAAAMREVDHLHELGLRGFQVYSSVVGRPLDDPPILDVLEYAFSRGLVCLLHPVRGPVPDYEGEERSRFALFRILGWPYETSLAMMRLVFSGLLERQPDAVIITHHLGAMIPYLSARIETHYSRANDPEVPVRLPRRPIEYLHEFFGDTALNGGPHAVRCGVDFFGAGRVLFGSDFPFDNQAGRLFIQNAIDAVNGAGFDKDQKAAIFEGNARRLLRLSTD